MPFGKRLMITIDGPAASGKSSAAKALAKRLGYLYLDTGALYRALAWKVIEEGLALEDLEAVEETCRSTQIELFLKDESCSVCVDGRDVTPFLRRPEVSEAASKIAALEVVRKKFLSLQREIGRKGGVVAEGRDTGTVVFPEADLKFYLDAQSAVRSRRRHQDLVQKGLRIDLGETEHALKERDQNDRQRGLAPLKPADDAIVLDSSELELASVVNRMLQEAAALLPASPSEQD